VTGLVLSIATQQKHRRRKIRIATAVLSAPVALLAGLFLLFQLAEPPTIEKLQRDFPSRRSALEEIVRMSDEDRCFARIGLNLISEDRGKPCTRLPKARWDAYRKLFERNGIKVGIDRDDSRDAFIVADSIGLLNRGHMTGYVYCDPVAPVTGYRFHPCVLRQKSGHREFDPVVRDEAYTFLRLDELWYAYDVGPS
jgi:hypothetical protein